MTDFLSDSDIEQLETAVDSIATIVFAYYKRLKQSGMSDDAAVPLTLQFQEHMLGMSSLGRM